MHPLRVFDLLVFDGQKVHKDKVGLGNVRWLQDGVVAGKGQGCFEVQLQKAFVCFDYESGVVGHEVQQIPKAQVTFFRSW